MLSSSLPVVQEMLSDRRYRQFVMELDELLRTDPNYTPRKLMRILEGAARGERVVKFEDRYVTSSFVPPIPSRAFLSFVRGGMDRENLYSDLAHARRSAPLSVHVSITSRCSYRCEHCGATIAGHNDLTTAQWVRVMRELQDLGVALFAFSGGEPLQRDDMEEIIGALDDRSSTLLFTNGRHLTLDRARALKRAGLFILAVSLDSPNAERHNRIRRNSQAFSHALAAIRNAAEAGLYTLVSSVVYKRDLNKENLHRLFLLAKEHGAHEVRIHQAVPRGQLSAAEKPEEIYYTKEDVARLYRLQFAANRNVKEFPKVSSFTYTEGPCKFGCGAGVLHSYITSEGDLWPCDFVPFSFGNIVHGDLKAAYGRMIQAAGRPRSSCFARRIAGKLAGKELPLCESEGIEMFRADRPRSYPGFFRDLQSGREASSVRRAAARRLDRHQHEKVLA